MPYLSRMDLNPHRRKTAQFLANPRSLHAAVMCCFPPNKEQTDARILWRIDRNQHEVTLWLTSSTVPSFEHLQEQAGWANEVTWETRDYAPLLNRLIKGQQYRFRLAANPVVTARCEDGKKRRLPLVREHEQISWLTNRSEQIGASFLTTDSDGAEIPAITVTEDKTLRFRREKQTVTLARVQLDGVLTVTDPKLLADALVRGVGKGKGYGLGMLTLAAM